MWSGCDQTQLPSACTVDGSLTERLDSPLTLTAHRITATAKSIPLSLQNAQMKTFTIENPNIAGSMDNTGSRHLRAGRACIAHARHKSA